jgi:hypothetical protein
MDTSKNPERRWVWTPNGRRNGQWALMNINPDDPAYEGSQAYKEGQPAPKAPMAEDAPAAKNKKRTTDS